MLRAQNDLYMVVPTHGAKRNQQNDNTVESLKNGELTLGELQRSVMNILNFILKAPVMKRPFNEVNVIEVTQSITTGDLYSIEEDIVFNTKENTSKWIEIKEEGVFNISINTQYNDSPLAQSMVNINLNDEYLGTIQMNGRGDKWMVLLVGYAHLVPGHYKIEILYKTPGIKVGTVRFKRV